MVSLGKSTTLSKLLMKTEVSFLFYNKTHKVEFFKKKRDFYSSQSYKWKKDVGISARAHCHITREATKNQLHVFKIT